MQQVNEYPSISLQPNFKPIDHIFVDRLRQFTDGGGRYRNLNLPKFYDIERVDTNTQYINIQVYKVPDDENGKTQRPLFRDIDWSNIKWEGANKGNNFGPSWKTFWFKVEWNIPEHWIDDATEEIHFEWNCDNEGLIYDSLGMPLQAFSGGERYMYKLPKEAWYSGKQLYYIEISCNGMFGLGQEGNPDPNRYFRLSKCDLVLPNTSARRLFVDFWILSDAARELGGHWTKYQAADICNKIMDAFDPDDPSSVERGREIAKTLLGDKIDSSEVFNLKRRINVYAIGNCHIDTAWLWPFAETKRKIVRSWTTQIKLANEYPEFVFVASQMQQFKWLKMYHPEILVKIKEKFATNQFLPVGGSWVENDTNLPNGESLIRQFLLGQRFQFNEFGIYANTFWLPDTFGYSSQIPQICQLVGISRFLTQKLSWNNINSFPLSTFNWVGLNGSQVLVHMPPANTYTASAHFGDVIRSQNQHKNMRNDTTGMLLYGHGDGGGGPKEEMLEKLRRCRGLADKTSLIPTVHVGHTVDDFYENVLKNTNNGSDLPSWCGEIYLEFHRGTYTSQADVKRYMREGEIKLHDLEYIATLVSLTDSKYIYPSKEIQSLWEDLCLCQFHDVLPGSCIGMVYYEEVKPMLENVLENTGKLIREALNAISDASVTSSNINILNSLPWDREEVIRLKEDFNSDIFKILKNHPHGVRISDSEVLLSVSNIDGSTVVNRPEDIKYAASVEETSDGYILSNGLLKATISQNGILTSIMDIENDREIIDSTKTKRTDGAVIGGNQFLLFDDEPLSFPAWDTELYSLNKYKFLNNGKVSNLVNNKLESSLTVRNDISKDSFIETIISIEGLKEDTGIVRNNFIKFKCHVRWHETYKFLKVQFPTTIYTAPQANYETQFGITQRPTHFNTSWDVAKFEVCHHKFMDLSDYSYGISILNNSKYGAAIHGNLMCLSLLRAPKAPDEKADMGDHDFEYAIYPHAKSLGSETVKLGYNFNYRAENFVSSAVLPKLTSSIKLDGPDNLILSHLKRSEDDSDVNQYENIESKSEKSFIVRIYESLGGAATGTLTLNTDILPVKKVYKTNALEMELEELQIFDGKVKISLKGFEIATYKFSMA